MYIRFITEYRNEDGEIETGVFQALGYLLRSGHALEYDVAHLKELRAWFNTNLEKPGYIIYEDEFQVATLPFKGDREVVR
jgi:hypothetical protein